MFKPYAFESCPFASSRHRWCCIHGTNSNIFYVRKTQSTSLQLCGFVSIREIWMKEMWFISFYEPKIAKGNINGRWVGTYILCVSMWECECTQVFDSSEYAKRMNYQSFDAYFTFFIGFFLSLAHKKRRLSGCDRKKFQTKNP